MSYAATLNSGKSDINVNKSVNSSDVIFDDLQFKNYEENAKNYCTFIETSENDETFHTDDLQFFIISKNSTESSESKDVFLPSKINENDEEHSEEVSSETETEGLSCEDEYSNELNVWSDIEIKLDENVEKSSSMLEVKEKKKELTVLEKRLILISQLKELWEEKRYLKLKNRFLHNKCNFFLGKYKIMSYFEQSAGSSSIYSDKRYEEILETFNNIQTNVEKTEKYCKNELEHMEINYHNSLAVFNDIYQQFIFQENETALKYLEKNCIKKLSFLQKRQEQQLKHLTKIRVNFFKLKKLLERINNKSETVNDFGESQTLNDYTNLLTRKHKLAERLDERDEEIAKMRKKIFTIVPMLLHITAANSGLKEDIKLISSKLQKLEEITQLHRSFVVKVGRKKDGTRKQFLRLSQMAFLLTNPKLLEVLLNSIEELENLKKEIDDMKLLLKCKYNNKNTMNIF